MLSYLNECLDNGNIGDARKLLENYQELTITKNRAVYTGISSLDFMLNIKIEKIKELGIKFKADIRAEKISMEELDFIMMLGNLLDNAIESAAKCKKGERYITFKIYNINDIFGIKIKNSSILKPKMLGNQFFTDKKEKDVHGWGIKSVKKILEKYNGELNFKYDNSFFEIHIIMEVDK